MPDPLIADQPSSGAMSGVGTCVVKELSRSRRMPRRVAHHSEVAMSRIVKPALAHSEARRAFSERTTVVHPRPAHAASRRSRRGRGIVSALGLLVAMSTPVDADSMRAPIAIAATSVQIELRAGMQDRQWVSASVVLTFDVMPVTIVSRYTISVALSGRVQVHKEIQVRSTRR